MANNIIRDSQSLATKINTMRVRIRSGQLFQLREIKEIRTENENLIIDWRLLRGLISDDTYFSVLEVLTDSLNSINKVYLETITRGRGRLLRDFLVFRENDEGRDYGFTPGTVDPLRPSVSPYNDAQGTRREEYQYRNSYRYVVRFGDTLQSIAQFVTGNDDNWHFIAQINGITRPNELEAGDEIIIPLISSTGGDSSDLEDFIISEVSNRDFSSGQDLDFGTDIMVDAVRGIVLESDGQTKTVSGADNVKQALNHRLRTQLGSLIRHSSTYGLSLVVGIPGISLSSSYIRMAIENTLIHDPRVARVLSVNVDGRRRHVQSGSCD